MPFDHFAHNYDADFTHTQIGKKQRQIVHDFILQKLSTFQSVFEVACGTGEDATWLAQQGKRVLATDISPKMLETGRQKAGALCSINIEWKQLDITKLDGEEIQGRYDWIFSNFGGLNCLSPALLQDFLKHAHQRVLASNGRIVLVMMSKCSIWEIMFALRRLNISKAFRRWTNNALPVNVKGTSIPTWYYNPSFFRKLDGFEVERVQTVGFFLPPSYLESFFAKRPKLLNALFRMEKRWSTWAFLANFSDHYLIVLRPK
jgi:ubiquinone/menaquinone biosynthesis C-methylase UbiE